MIMKATHLYGPDDQPRKKSLMAPLVQELLSGGIVCGVLTALVAMLRYGTEGHSFPTLQVSRRNSPLASTMCWLGLSSNTPFFRC
jgi:hypothetical protein